MHYNQGRKRWNNGIVEKSSHECPGAGWVLGSLPKTQEWHQERIKKVKESTDGGKIYNNGTTNITLKPGEDVPDGFVLGMKPQSSRKNKYTNGTDVIECYAADKPDGWVRVLNKK